MTFTMPKKMENTRTSWDSSSQNFVCPYWQMKELYLYILILISYKLIYFKTFVVLTYHQLFVFIVVMLFSWMTFFYFFLKKKGIGKYCRCFTLKFILYIPLWQAKEIYKLLINYKLIFFFNCNSLFISSYLSSSVYLKCSHVLWLRWYLPHWNYSNIVSKMSPLGL